MPKFNTDIHKFNKLSDDERMIPLKELVPYEITIPEHLVPAIKILEDAGKDNGGFGTAKFLSEILTTIINDESPDDFPKGE